MPNLPAARRRAPSPVAGEAVIAVEKHDGLAKAPNRSSWNSASGRLGKARCLAMSEQSKRRGLSMIAVPWPEPSPLEKADGDRGNRASFVSVRTVSKRFGVVQALEDVSLVIRPGEILALVGENGAGKSTLVRILEGVHRPDRGSLEIGGVARTFRSPGDAHAHGIRVIHQEPDIIPDLSIAENLFLGDFRRVNGDLSRQARSRATNPQDSVRLRPGRRTLALDPRGKSGAGAAPVDGDHAGAPLGRHACWRLTSLRRL